MSKALLANIKWNDQGLIPAIAQDHQSGRVLMMAWMNAESLQATLESQSAVYWSRSRQRLWRKGEQSGHVQKLHDLLLDCDGDTLLLKVEQVGGIACHTGRADCFFQRWEEGAWQEASQVLKSPQQIYSESVHE